MKLERILYLLAVGFALAQILLVPLSWMMQSLWPLSSIRSLLGSDGIRWFMGSYADMLATPVLSWLVLLAPAIGAWRASGISHLLPIHSSPSKLEGVRGRVPSPKKFPSPYIPPAGEQGGLAFEGKLSGGFRKRFARNVVFIELALIIVVLLVLTCPHHPILSSATGRLFPSSFSRALVPIFSFTIVLLSSSYAFATRAWRSAPQLFNALCDGYRLLAPFFLLYILASQFWFSILFVIGK